MNAALERLLEARSIEIASATDEEVTSRWRVAVGTFQDSRRVVTVEMRIAVAYQAALQAAMTLMRSAGYRLRSTPGGHHHATFATVAALADGDLRHLANELNRLSRRRHRAVYDWHDPDEAEEQLDPLQLERAVAELMEAAHRALAAERPEIAGVLAPPSHP